MSGEIRSAIATLNGRKDAIVAGQGGGPAEISSETISQLLTGCDLDPGELREYFEQAGFQGVNYLLRIEASAAQANAACSLLWLDGLAIGLLIAQARDREAAGA